MELLEVTLKGVGAETLTLRFGTADTSESTRERMATIAWVVAQATGSRSSAKPVRRMGSKSLTDVVQDVTETTS